MKENLDFTSLSSAMASSSHAVVHAAAGTGKTWLLTSRLLRLLLAGADPGSILAITFTRRAAGELQQRLRERLFAMASADDPALDDRLREIAVEPTPAVRATARALFESWVSALHPLRTTTFHAFCHEILQRFALEAGVPPAFGLCERTAELEAAAWHAFDRELTQKPTSPVADAMDTLLHHAGSVRATRVALTAFLQHRSDWWTYTEGAADPVAYAAGKLPEAFAIVSGAEPLAELLADPAFRNDLAVCADLLSRHPNATHAKYLEHIGVAQAPETSTNTAFAKLRAVFLDAKGQARSLRATKILIERLGAADVERLQVSQARITERLCAAEDIRRRIATARLSQAWYRCGQRLLDHFQRLKHEQNLLDFTDLEWHTYQLLTHGQHADWIQYKLDRRVAHLLVDEFQDTNPTQWRLLLPLLAEMAAGESEKPRSVFLVGDEKQSIYRFRRAEPRLFDAAHDWLTRHLNASTYTQHVSWRSSPAIIDFINLVFERPDTTRAAGTSGGIGEHEPAFTLSGFQPHASRHEGLWGTAQLLPLIRRQPSANRDATAFRNPLLEPRIVDEDERHRREGDMIADRIKALVGRAIGAGHGARPLRYGDVIVLLRDRIHAPTYESALRDAGIPYVGAERGGFMQCLEVRDLVQLLTVLATTIDDVALASVLRSPIFAATDADVLALAATKSGATWYERLLRVDGHAADSALARAQRLLPEWKALADRVPVHDLLDHIYFAGDVVARYQSAAPPELKDRVIANLHRLLALALDMDAGRFPSLSRFLASLAALAADDPDAVGALVEASGDAVRLMTIHAAKGLESPVVFLANAAQPLDRRDRGMRALVEWPVEDPRPRHFHLIGKKETVDGVSRAALDRHELAARREQANLLYVALTRAKQALYVSGCEPGRDTGDRARGWYGFIESRLERAANDGREQTGLTVVRVSHPSGTGIYNVYGGIEYGQQPAALSGETPAEAADVPIDPALTRPFLDFGAPREIVSPSRRIESSLEDDRPPAGIPIEPLGAAKQRGVVIHRMLELLTGGGREHRDAIRSRVEREWRRHVPGPWFDECWREACAVVDEPGLRRYFDPAHYREARNEVALLYRDDNREVYGVIDRLVIGEHETVVIDYKTHRASAAQQRAATERFAPQLRLYAAGVRRLWPGTAVRALLLYTATREAVEIDPGR